MQNLYKWLGALSAGNVFMVLSLLFIWLGFMHLDKDVEQQRLQDVSFENRMKVMTTDIEFMKALQQSAWIDLNKECIVDGKCPLIYREALE